MKNTEKPTKADRSGNMTAPGWEGLAAKQRQIIEDGFSSGNALICGGPEGVFFENYEGTKTADPCDPVCRDTIFHLYSMTKVFTVTAVMQLVEKGVLGLDDPAEKFIPEFGNVTVWEDGRARPAVNKITVRMLLTMTSGLSYFLEDPSGKAKELADRWRADIQKGRGWNARRAAAEIASVPLSFEPGEKYLYGLSHDVLGAIVETVSGETLDAYFAKHIFEPLGMKDTFFYQRLPEELKPRLAENTAFESGRYVNIALPPRPVPIPLFDGVDDPEDMSGGSGLVGTTHDFALFLAEMLDPAKGILKRGTVENIVAPRLNEAQRRCYNDPNGDPSISGPEHTFALGVRVQDREAASGTGSVGEWGWSGALGTWFFVSPKDRVWFVYMHQHTPALHDAFIAGLRNKFYEILKREPGDTDSSVI